MKKNITLLSATMLLLTVFQTEAQNTLYPGVTSVDRTYMARKVSTPPTIDGDPTDAAWATTPWRQAAVTTPVDAASWPDGSTPTAPEGAFSGVADIDVQFKIVWDDNHYYIIFRHKDDNIIYADNHNGYRTGYVPAYATASNTVPALGAGDGSAYQSFRMDQFAFWFTPHTDALGAGTQAYNRAQNGLFHTFFPGKLTPQSTQPEAVLWAPKHVAVASNTAPQDHVGTVAGTSTNVDGYFYIEFRDDTWSTLFNSVRTKLTDQKLYGPSVPAVVGDKFLLQGEVNDADGTTNRRDYVNYGTHMGVASTNPSTNLSEALVVTLANADGTLGLKSNALENSLKFYVDNASILRLNESLDVEIYNMVGQRVIKSVNSAEVNISSLPKGVYLLKDTQGKTGKLIKE